MIITICLRRVLTCIYAYKKYFVVKAGNEGMNRQHSDVDTYPSWHTELIEYMNHAKGTTRISEEQQCLSILNSELFISNIILDVTKFYTFIIDHV